MKLWRKFIRKSKFLVNKLIPTKAFKFVKEEEKEVKKKSNITLIDHPDPKVKFIKSPLNTQLRKVMVNL